MKNLAKTNTDYIKATLTFVINEPGKHTSYHEGSRLERVVTFRFHGFESIDQIHDLIPDTSGHESVVRLRLFEHGASGSSGSYLVFLNLFDWNEIINKILGTVAGKALWEIVVKPRLQKVPNSHVAAIDKALAEAGIEKSDFEVESMDINEFGGIMVLTNDHHRIEVEVTSSRSRMRKRIKNSSKGS